MLLVDKLVNIIHVLSHIVLPWKLPSAFFAFKWFWFIVCFSMSFKFWSTFKAFSTNFAFEIFMFGILVSNESLLGFKCPTTSFAIKVFPTLFYMSIPSDSTSWTFGSICFDLVKTKLVFGCIFQFFSKTHCTLERLCSQIKKCIYF